MLRSIVTVWGKYQFDFVTLHLICMWRVRGLLGRLTEIVKLQFSNKHVLRKFCSVDHASRYMCAIQTNLMHYFSSVYFVGQSPHVLGIFVAHHQDVYCIYIYIYTTVGTCCAFQLTLLASLANGQSTEKHNTYQLLYIFSIPPDDGPQICPKHVGIDRQNKRRINSASSWFVLHTCIEMHGQQNKIYVRHVCLT